jgi:hypothetical protein
MVGHAVSNGLGENGGKFSLTKRSFDLLNANLRRANCQNLGLFNGTYREAVRPTVRSARAT